MLEAATPLGEQEAADLDGEDDEVLDVPLVLRISASTRLASGPINGLGLSTLGEGPEGWTYYVMSTRSARRAFGALLADYAALSSDAEVDWDSPKSWAKFVDNIDGISLYGPDDRADGSLAELDLSRSQVFDCLLWPSGSAEVAAQRIASLTTDLQQAEGEPYSVLASDRRPDRTLVRVRGAEAALEAVLASSVVERVRAPMSAAVTEAALQGARPPTNPLAAAQTTIGVVDDIVSVGSPLTGPYLRASAAFPTGHAFGRSSGHGTSVAGNAIWGELDALVTGGSLQRPHPVVSARVLAWNPVNNRPEVVGIPHETIEQAVRWVKSQGVKVVNLSINRGWPAVRDPLRDELTYTLDLLARELQVVIVVSVGNRLEVPSPDWLVGFPSYLTDSVAGIAAPADGALVVSVGSYASRDAPTHAGARGDLPIARANEPSPFTRLGPARSATQRGMLKPEFAHRGGNWTWDGQTGQADYFDPGTASVVADDHPTGRVLGVASGTSFAAPKVAHEIAAIAERYERAGPNLLRALAALSARPTGREVAGVAGERWRGYGCPSATRVLESSPQRVFLVDEVVISAGGTTIHEVPIPRAFADGVRERTFRVALAFDPPVRRSRREYVAGTMGVELVRGLTLEAVERIYSRQPTRQQLDADPSLVRLDLPDVELRPRLDPGVQSVQSNTLIRRDFRNGVWDPDHERYFLVVTHTQSPWSTRQRREYSEQAYALAVEVADETRTDLDLYALMRARLTSRARLPRR